MSLLGTNEILPKVFGWQHLIYLAVFLSVSAAGIVCFKLKARGRAVDIVIKATGGVLLCLIVWNRISIAIFKENPLLVIPDSFCGVSSVGLGLCAIFCKKDALPLHYFCYSCFFGGTVNVVYPYYVSQSPDFLLPATISGLLHHGVAMDLSIMMLLCGFFKPSTRKFYAFPFGVCFSLVYGIFLVDALGTATVGDNGFTTAMNIYTALVPGTFMTWYVVYPAMSVFLFSVLCVYEYVVYRRRLKTAAGTEKDRIAENSP